MRPILGECIRCPLCGCPAKDVSPTYAIAYGKEGASADETDPADRDGAVHMEAHCVTGHRLHVLWTAARFTISAE